MHRWLLAILFSLIGALPAYAQTATVQPLTLTISPDTPQPYETVTVTPDSTLFDPATARFTISVNGTVVASGGVQSVPVTVAGPGESTTITAKAVVGSDTYTKQVVIRPSDVALVVEPISSTHPFYLGGSLTAPEGRVRIIAIPDLRTSPNARINAASLIYTWKWGDQVLAAQSGVGRSVLTATAPVRYRDAQISVSVSNQEQTLVAAAATVISPVDPIVRIYHADPLMGPDFDHALAGSFAMNGEEDAFRGVAYFFGSAPSLSWAINSQPASSDSEVTVRTTGTGQGTATLSLSANDSTQTGSAGLSVRFGSKKSNIFGF